MAGRLTALPSSDTQLLAWVNNFKTLITATPTTYGLTAAQATAFGTLVTTFANALAACEPGVRNKSATATKNDARTTLKKSAGELASIITGQPTVTDAQRFALGLNVRAMPQPVPPPSSQPLVEIVGVSGRTVSLRFKSTETIGKRGRPAGTQGVQIWSYVGTTAPMDTGAWKFEGTTSRTFMDVPFPESVAPGTQVWVSACWVNPRLETGPAATPVTTHLQFGNVLVVPQAARRRRAA